MPFDKPVRTVPQFASSLLRNRKLSDAICTPPWRIQITYPIRHLSSGGSLRNSITRVPPSLLGSTPFVWDSALSRHYTGLLN